MMMIIKVFGIFFSCIFLFSCVEKKKLDKNLGIKKIHIYEHRSISDYEVGNENGYADIIKIKEDSTVICIDLQKDSLFVLTYGVDDSYDLSQKYKLKETKKSKNSTVYKPSIFNHIPSEYIERDKKYNFLEREIENDDYGVEFYFENGSRTYWDFYINFFTYYGDNYEQEKKNSKYPDLFPFFIILQELGTCAIYIDPDLDKALTKKCEINKEINREILRRYEQ